MAARPAPGVPAQGPGPLRPLSRRFYARPAPVVARDLLGRLLVHPLPEGALAGRIVECEAYQEDDPASHSYRGRTARTEVMFGPAGHLYVYFSYGVHWCANVVTGRDGEGSAVLLRAVEPLLGLEEMARRRTSENPRLLCSGPGRLTQAFGITRSHNGIDLTSGNSLFVSAGRRVADGRAGVAPRVGISSARVVPWRFYEVGSPFVSAVRATRSAARVLSSSD